MTNEKEQKPKYDFDFDSVETKLPKKEDCECLSYEELKEKVSLNPNWYIEDWKFSFIKDDVIVKNKEDIEQLEEIYGENDAIVIDGNLIFKGIISDNDCFIVLGDVICEVLDYRSECFGTEISGNIYAKYAVFDEDNGSSVYLEGDVYTPYFFTDDNERSGFLGECNECIVINYENDCQEYSSYDYLATDVEKYFVEEVLDNNLNEDNLLNLGMTTYDGIRTYDFVGINRFVDFIKSGKNPILKVPRTKEEIKALKMKKNQSKA